VASLLAVLGGAATIVTCGRRPPPVEARLAVASALGGPAEAGFLRALAPRVFSFPADHGPHPGFRTEWWYLTGNLEAAGGRRFGYQLTFFRNALAADAPARASRWAARQVYLGHFALTDVAAGRFHACERFRREALGLAGARGAPFRVWLDDWSVEGRGEGGAPFPLRLRAAAGEVALDLLLEQGKPPVLQGEKGLSRKGAAPGQASYYYSLTRMPSVGRVSSGGKAWDVRGLSWMDREWSTSSLGEDQVGWDWFALQLADGREVMLYRLRLAGGGTDPASAGSLVEADGTARVLGRDDAAVEVLERWESPAGGAYPSRWRVRVPAAGLELTVRPLVAGQEHRGAFRYWEGAVAVRGTARGRPVTGSGYVELTGYADAPRAPAVAGAPGAAR
jgi:predicted secreted hydrolase